MGKLMRCCNSLLNFFPSSFVRELGSPFRHGNQLGWAVRILLKQFREILYPAKFRAILGILPRRLKPAFVVDFTTCNLLSHTCQSTRVHKKLLVHLQAVTYTCTVL